MCGIAGWYNFNGIADKARFEQMVDLVDYRGPDDRGTYYQGGLALGHRRLAVVDLSADGHQPLFYKERYIIVFNGEIYNYKELRRELIEKNGYMFRTRTDTEVLAAAYDCWGKECVQQFNGMWAFAVLDREKNELFCSRDRFGIKPFYYYIDETQFLFGSEIKQIIYMLNKAPVANRKRVLEFLVCGDQDYTAETMFKDIMQLLGGYRFTFKLTDHTLELERYYNLAIQKKCKKNYRQNCNRFRTIFEDAINLRLQADIPVGYCLSGGLDSSAIVSMASELKKVYRAKGEQGAVSSCFDNKAYDEQEYIDEVIRCTKVPCHKIYPDGRNLLDEVDEIIWHMDEPFGSASIYAQWNVFREAKRNHLAVMLDGQGADEQLAGYSSFYGVYFAHLLKRFKFIKFFKEMIAYKRARASTEKYVNAWQIICMAIASVCAPKRLYGIVRTNYFKRARLPFTAEQIEEVYRDRNIYSMRNSRQYILDSMQYGMQALLHFEDRDSMAFSIESRVPFLDYRLVEAVFSMPLEHKIRKGMTKAVMRDSLIGILPEKIRVRNSKLGFATPEDQWINENYEEYRKELENACDILNPLLDKKKVMDWFDEKKGRIARGDFTAWRIICTGRWVKLFQVSIE